MKKKQFIALVLLLLLVGPALAQKYACVNTDYILKSIPDYTNAIARLDKYVTDWQTEINEKMVELDDMRADYEQESYLLPDNLKKCRKDEILAKEQEIKDLQQQRFGAGGDLEKRRAELLKPVQDRVYSMIEKVAHEKNYAFVFDRAGNATVLFANKKFDISDEVLQLLGIKPGSNQSPQGDKSGETSKKPTNPEMRKGNDGKTEMPLKPNIRR